MNALAQISTQVPAIRAMVPQTMEDVFYLADAVHKSKLAPAGLDNPQAVAIAILHGLELGVPPMTALQRIAVINGRPTIWGDLALALVRASGAAESIKEEITGEGENRVALCTVKRKGEPEPVVGSFSVADARRAGLWDDRMKVTRRRRDGSGTYEAANDAPWHRFPERMMKMRARAFALRDAFADVLGGLYLREEIEEEQVVEAEPMRAMPRPPAPPKPVAALPSPDAQAQVQNPLDKLSNPEVREMVESSPSAPPQMAKAPPKPPTPPVPPPPDQVGSTARDERAPTPAAGAPRPPAPPAAGADLFEDDFPGDRPNPPAGEDLLTELEGRFAHAMNDQMLQRMWAFAEEDVNQQPMAVRQKAEALYEQHLARIHRKA
ncbi:recombinase RecT [Aquabacter sp. CN5-332]|uniref:recombinase RecT n=1 Tax=Aquabacter sp. CN5-332 TaxID=3156608 RepID=UPI0032B342E2